MQISCVDSIYGTPSPDIVWNAAVVVQGPHHGEATREVIEQFFTRNKDILVIVSTYLPDSVESFVSPYEQQLVDRGLLVYVFVKAPPSLDFWRTNRWNQNLQRLTTYLGLQYADELGIEFALKTRSDTFLELEEALQYLREDVDSNPAIPRINPDWANQPQTKIIKGRIAISGQGVFNASTGQPYPFHVPDFWLFGHTTDLMRYFDISEESGWSGGAGIMTLLAPESNMALRWMSDMAINVSDTMELLARYFIVEDLEVIQPVRINLKCISYSQYLEARKTGPVRTFVLGNCPERVTTRDQWKTCIAQL